MQTFMKVFQLRLRPIN